MAPPEVLLSVRDIHTYYAQSYVLQGLSLDLHRGQIVAILGRNGMGKTTLVRSIAGLTPPRAGEVRLRDRPLTGIPPHQIARQGVALVPQGRRIFKSLTVRENLSLATSAMAGGRRLRSDRDGAPAWTLERVLHAFPNLRARIANRGGALSGGEQQMLAIGRALMRNPDLILMDEPSEGLSPRLVQQVGEILQTLKQQQHSILLVEQNIGLALSVADYVYVLSVGKFVFEGTPEALMANAEVIDRHLGVAASEAPAH